MRTSRKSTEEDDDPFEEAVVCFYDNAAFRKVPKNATRLVVGPDLVRIDERAFHDYKFLKEVDMSKATSLQIIAKFAFLSCSALELVRWPPNVMIIGYGAFQGCASLEEADMSKLHALETIESQAFAYCSALALVKLSPNLKTIGNDAFYQCTSLKEADMSKLHALEIIEHFAFPALALVMLPPNPKTIQSEAFNNCPKSFRGFREFRDSGVRDVIISSSHHWFVRKSLFKPFNQRKLQSVDMQGHDLKKAIRIKNLYPRATPGLTMDRLVSMYAKSPLAVGQLENAAQNDESVTEEDWEATREEDLRRLGEVEKAYADSIFNLLHWYAGNGLVDDLFVNRKKRKRDVTI